MKTKYVKTASGMYINYFLLGMVNIILASNMSSLTKQWNTDPTGISYVIAAIGIGKLLTYGISGVLSDKIGRKPLIVASAGMMAVFLIGIPLSPTYELAFVFALLAGVANSAMDAGTYPALTELFPTAPSSANVLVKAFMSLGAALLPLLITVLADHSLFYGFSFYLPAAVYVLNILCLSAVSLPKKQKQPISTGQQGSPAFLSEPDMKKEGAALIIIGFTSTALFTVSQIWLPSYAQKAIGLAESASVQLLSYYSIGSLISVLLLALLLNRWVKPVMITLLYPVITLCTLAVMLTVHVPVVLDITAFFLGFSTAGVFQITVTLMTELFWNRKGTVTGIVATASSIASILLPIATGLIAKAGGIAHIFMFDFGIAVIGTASAAFLYYRYNKLTAGSKLS
ncbi:MFS transporter [Bacillus halotolerans]|uniref:MFS transporter n=1 Tax=Bacillus halotolerans TaxID=260554 RepID=UPI00227E7E2C|nr:MFS transporter [Bacillus halotolerans]MCY8981769.1 MFS transporter [Bacillus halotolerans]MEC1665660.1 MFS transporter [Bacillus halotolerans]